MLFADILFCDLSELCFLEYDVDCCLLLLLFDISLCCCFDDNCLGIDLSRSLLSLFLGLDLLRLLLLSLGLDLLRDRLLSLFRTASCLGLLLLLEDLLLLLGLLLLRPLLLVRLFACCEVLSCVFDVLVATDRPLLGF